MRLVNGSISHETTKARKVHSWFRAFVFSWPLIAGATAQVPRTVWDGAYSDTQATRGATLYADRCAACHADDLSGIDQAAPLVGADFLNDWNDQTVNDLFERIRISMPADQPGSLNRTQVADAVAFLLKTNGFPAGATDVPTAADDLKALKILAKKP